MTLNWVWLGVSAAIAAVAGSLVLGAFEIATAQPLYPVIGYIKVYTLVALVAWLACWAALAIAQAVVNASTSLRWVWHPAAATLIGATVGLISGSVIGRALDVEWWFGGVYGALSGLVVSCFGNRLQPQH